MATHDSLLGAGSHIQAPQGHTSSQVLTAEEARRVRLTKQFTKLRGVIHSPEKDGGEHGGGGELSGVGELIGVGSLGGVAVQLGFESRAAAEDGEAEGVLYSGRWWVLFIWSLYGFVQAFLW